MPGGADIRIAVDFGTSFSRVGWTWTGDGQTHIVTQWPGTDELVDSVPSTIIDRNGQYIWGFEIPEDTPRYTWMKYGLDPALTMDGVLNQIAKVERMVLPWRDHKHCKDLTTQYLTKLNAHTQYVIRQTVGDGVFEASKLRYTLTCPAEWPESEKYGLLLSARDAGMELPSPGHSISAPEAVALHALRDMASVGVELGNTFIICDAGTFMVNVSSYTIASVNPRLQLYEAAALRGSFTGSSHLDTAFACWLERKFRHYPEWDEDHQVKAVDHFRQVIKPSFGMSAGEEIYRVPAPGLADNPAFDIESQRLLILTREFHEIFEPVVQAILRVVQLQVQESRGQPKVILLAGGFGQNPYLKTRLREEFSSLGIAVETVRDSNTAVLRGALWQALAAAGGDEERIVGVSQRIAGKSYGILSYRQFNPEIHEDIGHRERDVFAGYDRVKVYHWFVRKGDKIQRETPITWESGMTQPVSFGPLGATLTTIYSCDADEPPVYEDHTGTAVREVVQLAIDLSHMPTEKLKELKLGVGLYNSRCYEVPYTIEMNLGSAKISFRVIQSKKALPVSTSFM